MSTSADKIPMSRTVPATGTGRGIVVIPKMKTEAQHARDHAMGLMRSLFRMYPKEAEQIRQELADSTSPEKRFTD